MGLRAADWEYVLSVVAQICNLLYRRFSIGRGVGKSSALAVADAPQNAILRYGRLQICATLSRIDAVRIAEHTRLRVFRPAPPPVGPDGSGSLSGEASDTSFLFREAGNRARGGACAPHRSE